MSGNNLWNVLLCFLKLWKNNKKKKPKLDCYLIDIKYFCHPFCFEVKVDSHSASRCPQSSRSLCCQRRTSVPCRAQTEHSRVKKGSRYPVLPTPCINQHLAWLFPTLESCPDSTCAKWAGKNMQNSPLGFLSCSFYLWQPRTNWRRWLANRQQWSKCILKQYLLKITITLLKCKHDATTLMGNLLSGLKNVDKWYFRRLPHTLDEFSITTAL